MAECILLGSLPTPTCPADLPAAAQRWSCDLSSSLTSGTKVHADLQDGSGSQSDGKLSLLDSTEPVHVCSSLAIPPVFRSLQQLTDRAIEHCWPRHEIDGRKALFLDYDGTLREFEARPEQAAPTAEIMELLRALDSRTDLAVHIISGRDAAFLQGHFGSLKKITLIAEHGYQIWKPNSHTWSLFQDLTYHDGPASTWKSVVWPVMSSFVADVPNSHIEEKATALVWHYREVCEDQAQAAAQALLESLEEIRRKERLANIKIAHGHKIVEVSYKKVNKGIVLDRLCKERLQAGHPFEGVLAIGDDKTDEFMFAAAPQDSLTVKVGPGDTQAKFRIESPSAVRNLLWQVLGH